ncbi:MAG: LptF/LptG family permease [Dysgonamonadaceae bacterium]|nr:LptF/LptG family permease [Dysgonamonadaceae bacterium]
MKLRLTIIDWYIIKKFLGTYIFAILLIIAIAVMIDVNTNLDKFILHSTPLKSIVFDYYFNFVIYYMNTFSPLFVFIAVIFFTSKLADNSEIIAMQSSGMSLKRLMKPYMISAAAITLLTFVLNSFVIPHGNKIRLDFQNKNFRNKQINYNDNIQIEVEPGLIAHFDYYSLESKIGRGVSLERFKDKELVSRLTAGSITYDSAYHWTINNYMIRDFVGMKQMITVGDKLDTTLTIVPSDFMISPYDAELLNTVALKTYIDRQKKRGIGNIQSFEIEYHKRFAMTFAAFILTVIGASLSIRKIKGGMGMNLGLGLLLSFSYILFIQISSTFAINGYMSAFVAVWIPNILYSGIAAYLYSKAPR